MTIQNLMKVLPPPAAPTYTFDGPWEPIEAELGTPLPQDYKDFARIYGDGHFWECLALFMPNAPGDYGLLLPNAYERQTFFVREHPSVRMFPQPGGLLACGSVDVGLTLFWLTRGPPSEWPIVVWEHRGGEGEEAELFECDLTDFIAGVVGGTIDPRAFPSGLELDEPEQIFVPTEVRD